MKRSIKLFFFLFLIVIFLSSTGFADLSDYSTGYLIKTIEKLEEDIKECKAEVEYRNAKIKYYKTTGRGYAFEEDYLKDKKILAVCKRCLEVCRKLYKDYKKELDRRLGTREVSAEEDEEKKKLKEQLERFQKLLDKLDKRRRHDDRCKQNKGFCDDCKENIDFWNEYLETERLRQAEDRKGDLHVPPENDEQSRSSGQTDGKTDNEKKK